MAEFEPLSGGEYEVSIQLPDGSTVRKKVSENTSYSVIKTNIEEWREIYSETLVAQDGTSNFFNDKAVEADRMHYDLTFYTTLYNYSGGSRTEVAHAPIYGITGYINNPTSAGYLIDEGDDDSKKAVLTLEKWVDENTFTVE